MNFNRTSSVLTIFLWVWQWAYACTRRAFVLLTSILAQPTAGSSDV